MLASRVLVLAAILASVVGCADGERDRRADAARSSLADASQGLDAYAPPGVDAYAVPVDAYVPPGVDAYSAPPDAYVVPGVDAWSAPVDAFSMGTGRYLDRCTAPRDCASGRCVPDRGGTSFCTRDCTGDLQCAHEHVCVAGQCIPDDTGEACSSASGAASCATSLCAGNATTGIGHCTRTCATSAECPAGYACARVDASTKICVDIERPCATPSDCNTGLCFDATGCTSNCESAADCPRRLDGLPPYTCDLVSGQRVCVVPDDVVGEDPAGASCRTDASGLLYTCRSGACDTDAPLGPMCTQACTAQGGCGLGLGCYPLADSGTITLICSRAGSRDIGASCASGRECTSALCDTGGYCTRLCQDGLCPTGWRCEPVAGFGISICRR